MLTNVQVVGTLVIIAWVVGTAGLLFLSITYTIGMRVGSETEEAGMDASEHGFFEPDQPVCLCV